MNIVHYTLGLPPFRSGGLTNYSVSLMEAQANVEDKVVLLFPEQSLFNSNVRIKKTNSFNDIDCYNLISKQPIPLLYGIKNPDDILTQKSVLDTSSIKSFLDRTKPDIIHIHTWMGMNKLFLEYAKSLSIKIVYTSHDFYGFCPRVNFVNCDGVYCDTPIKSCAKCNASSKNKYFFYFRNSLILLRVATFLSKTIHKKNMVTIQKPSNRIVKLKSQSEKYQELFGYYQELFLLVDMFHFNSEQSELIYRKYLPCINGEVITISHKNIIDKRALLNYTKSVLLRIIYIGSEDSYKGLPLLINSLTSLDEKGVNAWSLDVFGNSSKRPTQLPNITFHGKFEQSSLDAILQEKDLLIVPSICNETFGFVVLEAISRGIPVLVSNTVGAKDIVADYDPEFICSDIDDMTNKIKNLINDRTPLERFNKKINSRPFAYSMFDHQLKIKEFYQSILS